MAGSDLTTDELDLLADLDAGLLDGRELQRAEALAATDRGRAALDALARVRSGLAALPEPPVPAELDERLRAVLDDAAEPSSRPPAPTAARTGNCPGRHGSPGSSSGRPGPSGGPGPRGRSRRPAGAASRSWAWAAVAAAVVIGAAVGGGVLGPSGGGLPIAASGGGAGAQSSGSPRAERAGAAGAERAGASGPGQAEPLGEDETAQDLGAEGAAGAAGGDSAGPGPDVAPGDVPVLTTGRDYSAADLPGAAPRLAEQAASPPGSGDATRPDAATATAPAALGRLRDPDELAACLQSLAGGPVRPLAVDLARFEGQPALVAVLEGRDGSPVVHVAGPGCSAADADRLTDGS